MSEEQKSQPQVNKAAKSKGIKKSNRPPRIQEVDKEFEDLKRKYANAIAYLLVKNIRQSDLRDFFEGSEENKKKYQTLKKFRQQMIDARPKAKQWVDKPFYINLKLGKLESQGDAPCVQVLIGECAFKQATQVVSSRWELEGYMDTIAKIIESEKIWSDPDMAEFDIGEREDISQKYIKSKAVTQPKSEQEVAKTE